MKVFVIQEEYFNELYTLFVCDDLDKIDGLLKEYYGEFENLNIITGDDSLIYKKLILADDEEFMIYVYEYELNKIR